MIQASSSRRSKGFTLIELLVVIAIIAILASILFPVFARARENARRSSCLSNQKQIGLALIQYTQDYDETQPFYQFGTYNATWALNAQYQWFDAILPYIKSPQVFNCPSHAYASGQSSVKSTYVQAATGMTCLSQDSNRPVSYGANRAYYNFAAQPSCVSSCPNYSLPYASAVGSFSSISYLVKLSRIPVPAQTVLTVELNSVMTGGEASPGADLRGTSLASPHVYRHFNMSSVLFADGHVKSLGKDALLATHDVKATSGSTLIPVSYLLSIQDD